MEEGWRLRFGFSGLSTGHVDEWFHSLCGFVNAKSNSGGFGEAWDKIESSRVLARVMLVFHLILPMASGLDFTKQYKPSRV